MQSKKKILIFSLAYYPKHVGGAEVAIREITDRVASSDIEFHMVTLRFDSTLPKDEKIGNVYVHRIGFSRNNPTASDLKKWPLHLNKYLFQFLAFWKAHTLHLEYHFDGLWAMMAHATAVPVGLFNFFHPSIPFVLTLQEGDDLKKIERMARPVWPLFKHAFSHATVVQAISTYLADWARDMGATCPIRVVPNGVDIAVFSNTLEESERVTFRNKLGIGSGDTVLITTSRLVYKNAVDDVLYALKNLPLSICFLVVGTGPEEQSLRTLAQELGVVSRVTFVGHVAYTDVPKYLSASDVFIRPSRTEGMGNSFIEAMASGLPVVATQEGGLRDFIFDEVHNPDTPQTAWVVPKDSPDAIALAIEDIIARPEKVSEVVRNAREMITGTYEWNTIARTMLQDVFSKLS